jgi:ABC-2 type transport system permease protein
VQFPVAGYLAVAPALVLTGLMLGAVGLFLSSLIRQLENFAGIMNFVIFPVFFLSSALYPLWKMQESSELLYRLCSLNPFTYAVELIRFSLYCKWNFEALGVVVVSLGAFWALSLLGYDPKRGLTHRQTG